MSKFVWTDKGNTVHISPMYQDDWTRCGWQAVGEVEAGDVLNYRICQRCRTSIEKERERWVEPEIVALAGA